MADIQSLKQALAVSPDNVPLLLMLGEAYLEQFSLEEAKSSYESVLRVDPANPYARTQLVQLLDLDGRSSEAILRLEQVCGEYPNFGPGWMLRARLTLNENRAREAREYYERGVALDPALKNDDLLKRIRQAGGQRVVEEPRDPSPQPTATARAGPTMIPSSKRTTSTTILLMTAKSRSSSIKSPTLISTGSAAWNQSKRISA